MTVNELIEILKTYDGDAPVAYCTKRPVEENGYTHQVNSWEPLKEQNVFKAMIGPTVYIGDK